MTAGFVHVQVFVFVLAWFLWLGVGLGLGFGFGFGLGLLGLGLGFWLVLGTKQNVQAKKKRKCSIKKTPRQHNNTKQHNITQDKARLDETRKGKTTHHIAQRNITQCKTTHNLTQLNTSGV